MLAENYKIVPVMNSADISTSADTDSIDMSNYHKATFIFTFGVVTTDITFTPKSGISEGAKTTAVPSKYAAGGAAIGTAVAGSTASCDVLAHGLTATTAVTTANSNTFYVIEISASAMTDGHDWLTITLTTATGGICHAVAILEPRYGSSRIGTCLK
jgi:hypothetical protein